MSPVLSRNLNRGKAQPFDAILAKVMVSFPSAKAGSSPNGERWIAVQPSEMLEVARFLKNDPDLSFDSLACLTGVDLLKYPVATKDSPPCTDLVCVYDLHSLRHNHELRVKSSTSRELPVVASVESVWGVASFFEREAFDLLGVSFAGHPNLRRILLPEDWIGNPLRKDYVYPQTYGGVELKREGQTFESGPYQ